jgi:hypothetical protein
VGEALAKIIGIRDTRTTAPAQKRRQIVGKLITSGHRVFVKSLIKRPGRGTDPQPAKATD